MPAQPSYNTICFWEPSLSETMERYLREMSATQIYKQTLRKQTCVQTNTQTKTIGRLTHSQIYNTVLKTTYVEDCAQAGYTENDKCI